MKKEKKREIYQSNKLKNKGEKTAWDEFTDMFTMKQKPYNEAFIDRLCERLIRWAFEDPKALVLEAFFLKEGISQKTCSRWKEVWPQFKEAYAHAKQAIAIRRETGWITKEYASDITKSFPLYSSKWKKLEEWRASLRNEKEKEPTKIVIEMNKISESNE